MLQNKEENEIFASVAMWLDALDLVLSRLQKDGLDFSRVKGVSGAGMQHGTVFWSEKADQLLGSLDSGKALLEQLLPGGVEDLDGAFAHTYSPNWQDASTQKQCELFDAHLGSPERLAEVTGSKAHHVCIPLYAMLISSCTNDSEQRFSGPQILRYRTKYPEHYKKTSRVSLVSSFISSMLLGKVAPMDIGDVCGANLWDIHKGEWNADLLSLCAGGKDGVEALKKKLGHVHEDGGISFGNISSYFTKKYGFNTDCQVIAATGDNPSTVLSLPLREGDAMVSLGTSTTFLMSTPKYIPDPAYHFMNHPTTAGLYMFMLCYKNGGLAREKVRDKLNGSADDKSWDKFNEIATKSSPLNQKDDKDAMKIGLFFPLPEIVPNVPAGTHRFLYDASSDDLKPAGDKWPNADETDARAIVESQFLSLRLRSQNLVSAQKSSSGTELPAQPRRIYLVGGGSQNEAIATICADVLGSAEGVYRLDIGGNACALGAAYKAVWGCERKKGETFEELIGDRWDESKFVMKICDGYGKGTFEKYGEALKGFDEMEKRVIKEVGEKREDDKINSRPEGSGD